MYQYPEAPRRRGRRLAPVAVTVLGALLLLGVGIAVGLVQPDGAGQAVAAPLTKSPTPPATAAPTGGPAELPSPTFVVVPSAFEVSEARANQDALEADNDAVEQAMLRRMARR